MKIESFFCVCILFCFSPLFSSQEIDREIVVPLARGESLLPIYVSCSSSSLRETLLFDLSQNGITESCSEMWEEESQLLNNTCFSTEFWRSKGYAYVLKTDVRDNHISATLFSLKTGLGTEMTSYSLRGDLLSDRSIAHKIADEVYEFIEGSRGIANTQIFYAVQLLGKGGCRSEIWTSDYDGRNGRQLTRERSYCIHPTLFPSQYKCAENRYLYVNYKLGQSKIFVASFDDFCGKPFLSLRGNQLLPSVSPSGNLIAFISDAGGRADLFLQAISPGPNMGPIGKPLQLYSFPRSLQASPSFSPDGEKIAFVSDREGTPRIYLIHIPPFPIEKRPQAVCLTRRYRENTCPAWSPDGTKLAYSAKIGGIRQIMVYDFITGEEMQLTMGKSHKENPCWAPNSRHIIFNTADPLSSELFLINLKQKKMVQITKGPGKKHYPAWRG